MQASGYSLLEILVIICIGAILVSVGIPHWKTLQLREELVSTTKQLAYFLNEVQIKANTYNDTYHFYLFSSPWCLVASKQEDSSSCLEEELKFIKPENSVEISGLTDKKTISFWGRRNMAQTGSLILRNQIGETKVLISFRGRIRFCYETGYLSGLPPC